MAWTLNEFDGLTLPLLYPLNFELVGSAKVREYLVPTMGGNHYDRYQDKYGNFEDVPLSRRTMRIDTVALLTGSDRPFTVYDNLRKKVGTRGKLYRRWASVSATAGEEPGAPDIQLARRERQWVWARLVEMPRKRHGTLTWDGTNKDSHGTTNLTDYSVGHQIVDFVFETVDPYWKAETATPVEQTITSNTQTTVNLPQGELPITDATLLIEPASTFANFKFVINGVGATDAIAGDNAYTAWSFTPPTTSGDYTINSGAGTVLRTDLNPATNSYSGMAFNTLFAATPTVTRVHNKAPLIYIPRGTGNAEAWVYSASGNVDLTFTYYKSFKE